MTSVLHVSQPTIGGVMMVVRDLVRDQAARGLDVSVACPDDGQLPAAVEESGVRRIPWHAGRSPGRGVPAECSRLKDIVEKAKPDVVHLHSSKAGLCGRLVLRGRLPTCFHPHGWSFHAVDGLIASASVYWERTACRWTHSTICVSDAEKRVGERSGLKACWDVVRNGIDLEYWRQPLHDDRAAAQSRLGLVSGAPVVICIGRICRQKGQDLLLRAWNVVRHQQPDASLILVGDGPDRETLQRQVPDGVTFVGARTDIRDWMVGADLVVMPSRWEGLSIALLEAMACERTVIATDVSGMKEAVGTDAGILVPPGDIDTLAREICRGLESPDRMQEIGRAARKRVEAEFNVRNTCNSIAAIYDRLLGNRAAVGA